MTDSPSAASTQTLREAYVMAYFSAIVLVIYAIVQAGLVFVLAPDNPKLKLMVEPYLLLLGLVLHVQWRRVHRTLNEHGLTRPIWIATGDCMSFVITCTCTWMLFQAFLDEAALRG
jgi:hypothetical protein